MSSVTALLHLISRFNFIELYLLFHRKEPAYRVCKVIPVDTWKGRASSYVSPFFIFPPIKVFYTRQDQPRVIPDSPMRRRHHSCPSTLVNILATLENYAWVKPSPARMRVRLRKPLVGLLVFRRRSEMKFPSRGARVSREISLISISPRGWKNLAPVNDALMARTDVIQR